MAVSTGAAILGAAGLGTAASLFGGHRHGGQTVQTTADWRTPEQKRGAQRLWDEFIDDFYGVSPIEQAPEALTEPKSYKQRLEENLAYLKEVEEAYKGELDALEAGYLTKTQEAVSPYQQQLTNVLGQLQGGYGLGTPVSFGFGGQRVASFVPRQSHELAAQQLEIGQQGMQTRTGLADLENALAEAAAKRGFDFSQKHTPNEIADAYSKVLEELMWKMNTGQHTTTGTIPGTSTWHDILSGVGAGADIYSRMYPWGVQGQPTINIVPSSVTLPTNTAPSSYYNSFFPTSSSFPTHSPGSFIPFPTKSF